MHRQYEIGVGATPELSLRVSVASLVGVLFESPENGRQMLALERTATLRTIEGRSRVEITTKPFGGAVRITSPYGLRKLIGSYHYDSKRSRQERDFRIQINPSSWKTIKDICREHARQTGTGILDPGPERELVEEFKDSLGIEITQNQYDLRQRGLIVEEGPFETDNSRAQGSPTVRIYYLFEARIKSLELIKEITMSSSIRLSDEDLRQMAREDLRRGGNGRANGTLALDMDEVKNAYRSIPVERRTEPIRVGNHQLGGNVSAVLEDIDYPRYQRYPC